jgi:hypothetical protein
MNLEKTNKQAVNWKKKRSKRRQVGISRKESYQRRIKRKALAEDFSVR